jgi:hypothetical protein
VLIAESEALDRFDNMRLMSDIKQVIVAILVILCAFAEIGYGCPPVYGKCPILPYNDEMNRDISADPGKTEIKIPMIVFPVDYMSQCYLDAIGTDFGKAAWAR